LWAINGTNWNAYDPLDGNWLFTLTNVPSGTTFYGPNGEILIYVLDVAHNWLALWNNTAAHEETAAAATPTDYTSANYFEWRPVGKTINASDAYSWNVTIPTLPSGSTIRAVIADDLILGSPSTFTETQGTTESGTPDPYTMWAISLKTSSRGSMIWLKNYPAPPGNVTRNMPAYRNPLDPVNRVFIMFDKETVSYSGYSVDDGRWLWTTPSENPWNMFQHGGIGGAHNLIVNGKLYSSGYSGTVYCYDTKNGNLLWNYNATSGFATPYPGYPLFLFAAADDKIYLDTCEHSANAPYWVGAQARCLNATTGKEI
jgi:outer membrane protein assembly factor BamB